MKNTIPIVFHGGSYGTYLEWVLYTLTHNVDIVNPITQRSNCHKFSGQHLFDIYGWRKYVNSKEVWPFVRFHPKTDISHDLSSILGEIAENTKQFIYIYFSPDSLLLGLANQFEKTKKDWWKFNFKHHINRDEICNLWNIDPSIDKLPRWVEREFLSFYMMPMWFDQIEWQTKPHQQYSNCYTITIEQLLNDFVETINQIQHSFDLTFVRPVTDLLTIHQELILCQRNINIKNICDDIISTTLQGIDHSWTQRSIIEESWIQWQLRNLGYEIKCHNLDIFPTNSIELQELLYKI